MNLYKKDKNVKKYYTTKEIAKGVEGLPPITATILRNLRSARKIKYAKLGKQCVYTIEWIEDYLSKNTVEPITA